MKSEKLMERVGEKCHNLIREKTTVVMVVWWSCGSSDGGGGCALRR